MKERKKDCKTDHRGEIVELTTHIRKVHSKERTSLLPQI